MVARRMLVLALAGLILALACVPQSAEASGPCSYIKYPLFGSAGKIAADKSCYQCCVRIHRFNQHKRSKKDLSSCVCSM